jgi:hypothetical protein
MMAGALDAQLGRDLARLRRGIADAIEAATEVRACVRGR